MWSTSDDRSCYEVTADADHVAIERSELMTLMSQGLEARGAQVDTSGTIKGTSGVRHSFDLIVTKDGNRVPVDVRSARTGRVELGSVLETYLKALDTGSRPAVIVAIPAASSDARKSALAFGLILVEGKNPQEALEGLIHVMDRHLQQEN
jgi:predicted RecB family endonuclease